MNRQIPTLLALTFSIGCASDEAAPVSLEQYAEARMLPRCATADFGRPADTEPLQEYGDETIDVGAATNARNQGRTMDDFGFTYELFAVCADAWEDECGPTVYSRNGATVTGLDGAEVTLFPGESAELTATDGTLYRVGLYYAGSDIEPSTCFNWHPNLEENVFYLNEL